MSNPKSVEVLLCQCRPQISSRIGMGSKARILAEGMTINCLSHGTVRTHVCIYVCMYVYMYLLPMYLCMYVRVHVCLYV